MIRCKALQVILFTYGCHGSKQQHRLCILRYTVVETRFCIGNKLTEGFFRLQKNFFSMRNEQDFCRLSL
ncbi:Uncharacterised protein [Vibrio cholerae]|nr:Uncharacterised protein [Vibrio cholerae]CSC55515.1 Uncharacterised protein [Vibrio cholerae]